MTSLSTSPPAADEAGCRILPWDSAFFQLRIGRAADGSLTGQALAAALAWCEANQIDCLYFLADPGDPETISDVEGQGFHLTDVRMTLEKPLDAVAARGGATGNVAPGIRTAAPDDVEALRAIAKTAHTDSRF